jgi:tRNA-uridine 2-sulfurtransferase
MKRQYGKEVFMKALVLFSGGLDSILAVKLLNQQGVDTIGICFDSPFFSAQKAYQSARSIGLSLTTMDITGPLLTIILTPRHGYGKALNPCIDCRILMFKVAGKMLERHGAHFIVSGEVVGQRPMSQNLRSLSMISKESGFNDLILRPLSAKRLPETLVEKAGWVDRGRLLGLSGRSRKPQIALAEKYGVAHYPSPAGGCLLTDAVFSRRLKDLITMSPGFTKRDLELLKNGRHFRINEGTKIVVGRNEKENEVIFSLAGQEDTLLAAESFPGPTVLVIGDPTLDDLNLAATITVSYSDAPLAQPIAVKISRDSMIQMLYAKADKKAHFHHFII